MVQFNDNSPEDLRRKLETKMADGPDGDLAAIDEALRAQADQYNHTPQAELQGYSPAMCHALRHQWNTPGSPIKLNSQLPLKSLKHSRIFNDIRNVLLAVREADGIKATPSGNFVRKFVEAMVDPLLEPEEKEHLLRYNKVLNETDFRQLHEARIVASAAGLLVKRKGIIRVAKKHQSFLEEAKAGALFTRLFDTYFRKYNIGYLYPYGIDVDWIQHEIGFLLYPLYLKARHWIEADVLPKKILHPLTLDNLQRHLNQQAFMTAGSVLERYFLRPLHGWGLLEIQWTDESHFPKPGKVRISPLFEQYIRFDEQAE
ncbi:hypothetical protein [Puniceicoccus vermicola]|uniref:Uncharacterized protein n=1 Tax=Puniceicoccus vermicola TaxID=388746 RepID=A0A7X1B253_9BACT|nr:hypothetical protein [Puniceicoccus vermicola]MBC2604244.1 hypothetical protein [Puniceicoccus vermicola]